MFERRKGTIQKQRINEQLLNTNFKIDDRSFEDLLGYIAVYLEKVNFYNTENKIDGNWKVLLENDPIIYIATIIKTPLDTLNEKTVAEEKIEILLGWYDLVVEWRDRLLALEEKVLASKIDNTLTDVLIFQRDEILKLLGDENTREESLTSFSQAIKEYSTSSELKEKINLDQVIHAFKKVLMHIQNFTKEYLRTQLYVRDNHLPNNAMYITFALLYRSLQDEINTISQRHLDFYYKDVLQQVKRKGIASRAIVNFELLPTTTSTLIPEGTELSAGKLFGSKQDILFKTEKPIVVEPVKLMSLQSLYLNESPYIKIGTKEAIVSNIIRNNLIENGEKSKQVNNWGLFGADSDTLINSEIDEDTATEIGFMVGSQALFLEEGNREITVTFELEEHTAKNIFWRLLYEIQKNENVPLDVAFNNTFENTFNISYTTAKQWECIKKYDVSYDEVENTFSIQFTLDNAAPAVAPLASESKHSEWPMIKVVFDELAPVYTYSFFRGVALEAVDIEVEVTGIKNISIHNNIGKMPLTKAFDMFGPLPEVGNYLMVGKSELLKKQLSNLEIHIDWNTIPRTYGGFESYYENYEEVFTNESFKVQVSALSNGYWLPRKHRESDAFELYTTTDCRTPEGYQSVTVDKNRTIYLDHFEKFELYRNYKLQDPIPYTIETRSGFFKIELINPEYAFGKDLYQKNYTRIATFNAKNDEELPLPNRPFTPKINGITLDYKAKDTIYFRAGIGEDDENNGIVVGDYIQITPFGTKKTLSNSKVYKNTMVPDFEADGYLYMGLSGIKPEINISLYFDLLNDNSAFNTQSNNISCEYKLFDDWIKLTHEQLISDETNELTKSGIIEFRLPSTITANESGYHEIRVIARNQAYLYPKIKGIYPNAVEVVGINEESTVIGKKVEASQINKLVKKIANIKSVQQPAESYGGSEAGTSEMLYSDVSERLRHKDRAVTIWDYERLILQYFSNVAVVKCTNLDRNFKPLPGKVKIILLHTKWTHKEHYYFNGNELDEIKSFIQKKASPFVNIEVKNPEVERLLVRCKVEFQAEDNSGYYIDLLNETINDYLCPLLHRNNNSVGGIGGIVIPRMLLSYMENLDYIKTIKQLVIERIVKKGFNDFRVEAFEDTQEIKATTPWSILTPVDRHAIYMTQQYQENQEIEIGINNLQVGLDFVIEADTQPEIKEEEQAYHSFEEVVKEEEAKPKIEKPLDTILTFKLDQ